MLSYYSRFKVNVGGFSGNLFILHEYKECCNFDLVITIVQVQLSTLIIYMFDTCLTSRGFCVYVCVLVYCILCRGRAESHSIYLSHRLTLTHIKIGWTTMIFLHRSMYYYYHQVYIYIFVFLLNFYFLTKRGLLFDEIYRFLFRYREFFNENFSTSSLIV